MGTKVFHSEYELVWQFGVRMDKNAVPDRKSGPLDSRKLKEGRLQQKIIPSHSTHDLSLGGC